MIANFIARFSIKLAIMYLNSQRPYMGSKWLAENVVRKS